MKSIAPFIALLLVGCATLKYRYYIDHYQITQRPDASSAVSNVTDDPPLHATNVADSFPHHIQESGTPDSSPLHIEADEIVADATPALTAHSHIIVKEAASGQSASTQLSTERSASKVLTKEDRKVLVHALRQIRKDMRSQTKAKSTVPLLDQKTQKLDNELIVAISFAAVGITLSILGGLGAGFWIAGVICLGVGVYFFIDWLRKR